MKIHKFILLIFIFGFLGCEKQVDYSSVEEVNSSKVPFPVQDQATNTKPEVIGKTLSSEEEKKQSKNRETTSLPALPEMTPPAIKKSQKIIEPEFTEELLKAVGNWKKIPKSVFPLKGVSIQEPVVFKLTGSNGQVIATTPLDAAKDVVVKGIKGESLVISPSVNSKFKTTIKLDKTDFKKGVAFRFEMGKKALLANKLATTQATSKLSNKNPPGNAKGEIKQDNTLLTPGDFGHGKFCICPECREKRLALIGSMK
jgi:hypothetical protein